MGEQIKCKLECDLAQLRDANLLFHLVITQCTCCVPGTVLSSGMPGAFGKPPVLLKEEAK